MKNTLLTMAYLTLFICTSLPGTSTARNSRWMAAPHKIERLYLLIHGFCYADMTQNKKLDQMDARTGQYLARERLCADLWRAQLHDFGAGDALVVIPWNTIKSGPVHDFNLLADSLLGDRFFLLDDSDGLVPSYWQQQENSFSKEILSNLKDMLTRQKEAWNKEELFTALHALNCWRQFNRLLAARDLTLDVQQLQCTSWGASYEGCVTKYSLSLRQYLHLAQPVRIDFDMTVPDADFLLHAKERETLLIHPDLQLSIFQNGDNLIACYSRTSHSLADKPAFVEVSLDSSRASIVSKQGIRLWPQAETYHLSSAPFGFYEPPHQIVKATSNGVRVTAHCGYVYRLAKAPTFIFASTGMTFDDFRDILTRVNPN